MMSTTTFRPLRKAAVGLAALLMAAGATAPANAATTDLTVNAGSNTENAITVTSGTTLSVSGSGYEASTISGSQNGVYIAFGGKSFTTTNGRYYYSAVWAQPNGTTTTATRIALIDGAFTGAQINVVSSYTATTGESVDCFTDKSDTTGEQCYIYTFSGWGAYDTETYQFDDSDGSFSAEDPNFTVTPVYVAPKTSNE